jgi:hypothetical protein
MPSFDPPPHDPFEGLTTPRNDSPSEEPRNLADGCSQPVRRDRPANIKVVGGFDEVMGTCEDSQYNGYQLPPHSSEVRQSLDLLQENLGDDEIHFNGEVAPFEIGYAIDDAVKNVRYIQDHPEVWSPIRSHIILSALFLGLSDPLQQNRSDSVKKPSFVLSTKPSGQVKKDFLHIERCSLLLLETFWGPVTGVVANEDAIVINKCDPLARHLRPGGGVYFPEESRGMLLKGEIGYGRDLNVMARKFNLGNGCAHVRPRPEDDPSRDFRSGERFVFFFLVYDIPKFAEGIPEVVNR